jgi:hypothetical protein
MKIFNFNFKLFVDVDGPFLFMQIFGNSLVNFFLATSYIYMNILKKLG